MKTASNFLPGEGRGGEGRGGGRNTFNNAISHSSRAISHHFRKRSRIASRWDGMAPQTFPHLLSKKRIYVCTQSCTAEYQLQILDLPISHGPTQELLCGQKNLAASFDCFAHDDDRYLMLTKSPCATPLPALYSVAVSIVSFDLSLRDKH